ncbi:TFIIB-type zinc ribbon-containing protein [Cellulomonas dongxiuzhuiae]|uniref:TFIIB-type zinc ribbon-containing protein n=1 Tax=Cellulomonas dongxiuzhuiae TaxID=2819979 RepID=UPI001AAE218C|nr:zf-TFIIB domain-containing protein [Cellulomonas dongxiuzhuiae]MBO3089540.1 zf-TFIIB domain-containing protein [Cellulomonas dongxiuzhuiae]
MQCPVDQAQLVMTERQGVEIDYCPVCRGIWLDRGELDKIIDRAATVAPAVDPRAVPGAAGPVYGTPEPRGYGTPGYGAPGYDRPRYDSGRDDRGYDRGHDGRKRKKKESWLEDLFDF